jgi:phage baseplate assembly protein W
MADVSVSLPFSLDAYGKVNITRDYQQLWADRVRATIGTALGERVMRPQFGSLIPFQVFNGEEQATTSIETDVRQVFNGQLMLLQLDQTEVSFDEYTGTINILVTYALPNEEVVSTNIGIVTVTGMNPTAEETK